MTLRTRGRRYFAAVTVVAVLALAAPLATAPAVAATHDPRTITVNNSCRGFLGAYALGTSMKVKGQVVRACGPRPSFSLLGGLLQLVLPFLGSIARYPGYQCVELSARYLAAATGALTPPGIMNGAQVVDSYAKRYPRLFVKRANGARHHAPRRGDVLSLANNPRFRGVGHTGVVLWSKVNKRGNGRIKTMEENWGGRGGARGWHIYQVHKWKVIFPELRYINWLHRR